MSQQHPEPAAPPPGMTGFTVTDGFSVIPPKRPTAVTVASWLMVVLAVLVFIGGLVVLVGVFGTMMDVFSVLAGESFWRGVLLVIAAGVTIVLSQLIRNASAGGQLASLTLMGGAAILCLTSAIRAIAGLPLNGPSTLTPVLVFVVAAGLTAAVVVLLSGRAAAAWFRQRRREVTFIDTPVAASRPQAFVVAVAFVGLTTLVAVANVAVYAGWLSTQGSITDSMAPYLVGYFASVAVPVLLALAVTAGLAVAGDMARIAAYGVCGFFAYNGLSTVVGFVLLGGVAVDLGWVFYLDLALGVLAAVSAGVALFALTQRQVTGWFDDRHAATTPPPEPIGQQ